MKLDNVQKFIELAKNEGVSELKYEDKEFKISVNFNSSSAVTSSPQIINPVAALASTETRPTQTINQDSGLHTITSPFVGTFYASPSPDEPAFINVGDKVSNGQTLCILEAMKIMNEIESDTSGEIVEICVENESLVEFGQTLFKIRK